MRILLLSAYDAASHRYWREQLVVQFPEHQFTVLTLPPRYFSWRIRGNPLSWLQSQASALEARYDALIATSMVDLATLRGLEPRLAGIKTWLYCHENQFVFPLGSNARDSIEPSMVFLYSCLAASVIGFNSAFNRDSALQGMQELSRRLPERIEASLIASIAAKSHVLPVPLLSVSAGQRGFENNPQGSPAIPAVLDIVWNHRWEYDKSPERLLAFLRCLDESSIPARVHVIGQQFRRQPPEFDDILRLLDSSESIVRGHYGYIPQRERYLRVLQRADIVLSTALHDFQGLSVLEAVQQGCVPLVPDRLAYPEWFGVDFLYPSLENAQQEAEAMCAHLKDWLCCGLPRCPSLTSLEWPALRSAYAGCIDSLLP